MGRRDIGAPVLTSVLDESEVRLIRRSLYTWGNRTWYPLDMRLGEFQSPSEHR
jgi:hypothetical protein